MVDREPTEGEQTVNKNKVDVSQVFLVFMALVGDAEKTALALDMNVEDVNDLAKKEGWVEKVRSISVMSKSGTPGDWERAQNRALNFVQCHQLRRLIDASIFNLNAKMADDPFAGVVVIGELGQVKLTARLFVELSQAMERVHTMTYAALGDSVKERELRAETDPDNPSNSSGLHAALISALNQGATLSKQPAENLIEAAVTTVQQATSIPKQIT